MARTPGSRNSYFDDFGFDCPQTEYAQVLEEARRHAQAGSPLESKGFGDKPCHRIKTLADSVNADYSSAPAHFKAEELQKSLGDLKKRRSWKNTLFFWRKSWRKSHKEQKSVPAMSPQHPRFKSQSVPCSGPIYATDYYGTPCPSERPRSGSLPIHSRTPKGKSPESEMPHTPLVNHNHFRFSPTNPIYLGSPRFYIDDD